MENLLDDMKEHFASKILGTVASLQSIEQTLDTDHVSVAADKPQWTIDCAGEAILNCLQDLSKPKAHQCMCKSKKITSKIGMVHMHKFICGIVTPVPYYILYADIRTCYPYI